MILIPYYDFKGCTLSKAPAILNPYNMFTAPSAQPWACQHVFAIFNSHFMYALSNAKGIIASYVILYPINRVFQPS